VSARKRESGRDSGSPVGGESIALLILAGVAVGGGVGYGIDRFTGVFPLFTVVGVFAGFALALYAVFIETR
jgi:F0F1-type ATP synthase assembly protein I